MLNSNGNLSTSTLKIQKLKRNRSVSPNSIHSGGQKVIPWNKGDAVNNKDAPGVSKTDKKIKTIVSLSNKEPTTIINHAHRSLPMRLLLVSSKCKSAAVLEKSVNSNVIAVLYNCDTVTYDSLLALICCSLDTGQQASSVACMVTCKPSGMILGHFNDSMGILNNSTPLSPKYGAGKFFKILFERFVDTRQPHCRLDLIALGCQQDGFTQHLQKFLGIPVYLSKERFASDVFVEVSDKKSTVGEMYFQADKLRNLRSGSYQTLDLFEKIRMVGKGAFGTAVLYKKKDDHSLVVLKEINMTELNNQERLMAMNEARVLAMLNHPNIICYYDTFEENGVLMIEMEYADDGTLAQFLSKSETALEEKAILTMFAQIVSGLSYMHGQKVLHRDLKTANIFMTKEGLLKIGDFGVSKIMTSRNNAANTVLGTPYYISPEICEGKPYDAKSDIWALGCILYEMATRQRTFEGTNLPALVNKIMNGQIAPIRGDYSVEMRRLVKDMLNKDPEQRPTASELESKRLPEMMARYPCDERPHLTPGSRSSGERKQAEGTRSVLYLYNTSLMSISLVDGLPSKIKIRQVAVGRNHVVVVAMERVVYTWGENNFGQLGHGHVEYVAKPLLVDALKGKSITNASCGANFTVFVSDNGIAMTCGDGQQGCLGHGDLHGTTRPRLIESLLPIDVASVACGDSHVVVLGTDGEVYAWGCGGNGRLGTGHEETVVEPTRIPMNQAIRDVRCACDATIFITEIGTLLACGNNNFNKLGLNERTGFLTAFQSKLKKTEVESRKLPTAVNTVKRVIDVAMAKTHTVVLTDQGQVWVMGSNKEGQMATKDTKPRPSPYFVKCMKDQEIMVVACGQSYTAVGTTNGIISFWGTRFGPAEGSPGKFLTPPCNEKSHQRTLSTGSTLSIRSLTSIQQDSASECVSRSSSLQDISLEEHTDIENQSLNASHSSDLRLPETFFSPVPILNIQSSQTSSEDLSAFLDNLIPFRENLFILVETNAPVTRPASTKEKRRKSIKDRISMENLKVPPLHHSISSNDDTSSEASEIDTMPTWIKSELEDAKKDEETKAGKKGNSPGIGRLAANTSARARKLSADMRVRNPSARSDSSSDSSVRGQVPAERRSNANSSSTTGVRPRNGSSPGRSKAKTGTAHLQPRKSPRATPSRSPTRSPAQLSVELERLADEKRKSDEKLEALRKDHEEIMKVMQANHEKEKIEQHRRMLDQIQQLREELQSMSQRQAELSRRSYDRSVNSKICVVQ